LLFNPLMKFGLGVVILTIWMAGAVVAQEGTQANPAPQKRGWMSRVLHPFGSSSKIPTYKNPKLNGLVLQLQISPQPVKLSETRQIEIKMTVTNKAKRPVELDFPTDQRIEIYLMNSAEVVLTKWSDNHAVTDKAESVLINPDEHTEYVQTIATRDLTPNKVFIAEVFFPNYPELRVRQKFLTEQ
jgi:intracellular proteinase inhibitor BsuPI